MFEKLVKEILQFKIKYYCLHVLFLLKVNKVFTKFYNTNLLQSSQSIIKLVKTV